MERFISNDIIFGDMVSVRAIMEMYEDMLRKRKGVWAEKYSRAVVEGLEEEMGIVSAGLETILRDSGLNPTADPEDPDASFYQNNDFKDLKLDEEKLSGLSPEEFAVLRFVSPHSITARKSARRKHQITYHHSATYGEIRVFLFDYWKENDPEKFRQIVDSSIKDAIPPTTWDGKPYHPPWENHFKELRRKDISQISFEDLEHKGYVGGYVTLTPLRQLTMGVIHELLDKGALRFTPGYVKFNVSLPKQYLAQ